ncbi:unknown [Clostridium sp. CAG:1000]|jgi:hypothetical protein|nr:unknown [Clostridium sp. CAG:1000]
MKNKNGFISMTLVYTFLILFLFLMSGILTSYNQRNKYYDIIEEKIKSEMDLTSFRNDTLYNTILKDNKAYPDDNDASPSVDSKDGIDFSKSSSLTNGIGLFYTEDTSYTKDNKTVYYFRGENVNNYIVIDGSRGRILRTTEDGNVKILFGGDTFTYNTVTGNKAVGFMYGTDEDEGTLTNNDLYFKTHQNINNSEAIKKINESIPDKYKNIFVSSTYCNNRTLDKTVSKISDISGNTSHDIYVLDSSTLGYGTYNTVYYNLNRIKNDKRPRFNCTRKDNNGNYVDYIESNGGLITLDEAIYSGIGYNDTENNSFVEDTLTMTPNYYYHNSTTNEDYAGLFKIDEYKNIITVPVNESNYADIVLTLKGDIIISKGNGTYDNPYIINGGA